MSLNEQIDYWGKLSAQFPAAELRVVYARAGTLPASGILRASGGIIDNTLYWIPVDDEQEARYLCAILNSESARARVEHLQGRGQWGARDFDKVMLSLPIPKYNPAESLHGELSQAARRAEEVAARVPLEGATYFVANRRHIREALQEDGVAQQIDEMVANLLG